VGPWHGHFFPCGTGRNACATEPHAIPAHRERRLPAPQGSINGILYMRSSQIGTSVFLVPTLRVGTLDHRSAVPAQCETRRRGAAPPNPNGVKENSLGRLAPGSVEIMVGQALKGRQKG
jgi:hypothetical protein